MSPSGLAMAEQQSFILNGIWWFVVRGSWSSFFMYLQYCGKNFLGNCSDRLLLSSSPPSILKIIMPRKRASEHRLVLELSVGLSFDQRQAQWRIDLFWQQLQALSARSCRSIARNLLSSGYTQLPLRERGRSSCPVKASYGSEAEQ